MYKVSYRGYARIFDDYARAVAHMVIKQRQGRPARLDFA